jgi:hypothetical protein
MCDYDTVECLDLKIVKLRRPRKCAECARELPAGVLAQQRKYLFDGCWNDKRVCVQCVAAIAEVDKELRDYEARERANGSPPWMLPDTCGPAFGELVWFLRETHWETDPAGDDEWTCARYVELYLRERGALPGCQIEVKP